MPVPFKGESEYDARYRWIDSAKSSTCKLTTEQEAPRAGLTGAKLGTSSEPPIQRRKKPETIETTKPGDDDDADEYILLGDQSKFAPSVKYRAKSPLRKTYKVTKHERSSPEPKIPKIPVSPPPKRTVDAGEPSMDSPPPAPRRPKPPPKKVRPEPVLESKHSKTEKKSPPVPKRSKSPPPVADPEPMRMNAYVQTDLKKGVADSAPEAPADYGMKYRAGIARRPEGIKRVSEYKKAFEWKDPVKTSPLLAAEQMVYKSDSTLGPYKSEIPRKTEYQLEFKKHEPRPVETYKLSPKKEDGPSPSKKSKLKKSASDEAIVKKPVQKFQPSEEDKKALKEAVNPQKAFFPHGKHRRTKSEYASNYVAPSAYSYEDGAWKGAYPAHIHPQKEPSEAEESPQSWFQEVLELRRKADEYRKRAYGTHFSRCHVGQLLAHNAELWDTASQSSRTVTAMSLETGSQGSGRKGRVSRDTSPPKDDLQERVKRKLAWTAKQQQRGQLPPRERQKAQSPPSVSEQGSVVSAHDSQRSGISTHDSQVAHASDSAEDELGRIPTPRLRQEVGSARRHHLDLTTPSVGGALLVSPPPTAWHTNGDSLNGSFREEPSKHSSVRSPSRHESDDDDDGDDESTPRVPPPRRLAPKERISPQTRVIGPRKTIPAPVAQLRPDPPCSCGADEEEKEKMRTKKLMKKTYKMPHSAPSPTFGKPTGDNCPLLDDEASYDRPLDTEFVETGPSSDEARHKKNPRKLSVPSTIQEGYGVTYKKPSNTNAAPWDMFGNKPGMLPRDEDDDDILSTSMRSIASSCSLASETLERAQKNRANFWGGRKGATVA